MKYNYTVKNDNYLRFKVQDINILCHTVTPHKLSYILIIVIVVIIVCSNNSFNLINLKTEVNY